MRRPRFLPTADMYYAVVRENGPTVYESNSMMIVSTEWRLGWLRVFSHREDAERYQKALYGTNQVIRVECRGVVFRPFTMAMVGAKGIRFDAALEAKEFRLLTWRTWFDWRRR